MARSLAREAEDFARLMLQTIERLSQDGSGSAPPTPSSRR